MDLKFTPRFGIGDEPAHKKVFKSPRTPAPDDFADLHGDKKQVRVGGCLDGVFTLRGMPCLDPSKSGHVAMTFKNSRIFVAATCHHVKL